MSTWKRYRDDAVYRGNILKRKKIMEAIRDFFALEGFAEIETPLLVRSPGMEPNLAPFKTTLTNEVGKKFEGYLITSPEYSCKKMLGAGMDKIFSLGKVFRNNEPFGGTHNPEFTLLEWYRAGADYEKIMDDTERLVAFCAPEAKSRLEEVSPRPLPAKADSKNLQPTTYNLTAPWARTSVKAAFAQIGLNLDQILTRDKMAEAAVARGYAVSPDDTFDDCFFKIFLTEIEPRLGKDKPVFLYDYPIQMAALARPKAADPRYAERFEAYANGLELCNAFSELVDPQEQRRRFEEEAKERARLGKDVAPTDDDLLAALGGIKSAAGNALGVDRLVMLLTGAKSIDDVLLFPASEMFEN
jgi:elongation factor P--(R)-beta-lysine ligase